MNLVIRRRPKLHASHDIWLKHVLYHRPYLGGVEVKIDNIVAAPYDCAEYYDNDEED